MQTFITGQHISTSDFKYNAKTKEFIADRSTLHADPLCHLYGGSPEVGFVMVSTKTNMSVEFKLVDQYSDADHQVRFWEFRPSWADVYYNPGLRHVKVIIHND